MNMGRTAAANGTVAPQIDVIVPALLESYRQGDDRDRYYAIMTLGHLSARGKDALHVLQEGLASSDTDVRMQTAQAICHIDPKHEDAWLCSLR
jgi:hypothetical protein